MSKASIEILKEDDSVFVKIQNIGLAKKKQGKSWTFYCPSLKVIGYSNKSERDALRDFEENLSLFFTIHIKDNSLDRALTTNFNWTKRSLSVAQVLKAKKALSPKLEFTNKTNSGLKSADFKVPVLDLAA